MTTTFERASEAAVWRVTQGPTMLLPYRAPAKNSASPSATIYSPMLTSSGVTAMYYSVT